MLISLRLGDKCNRNCEYCDYQDIQYLKDIDIQVLHKNKYIFDFINKYNIEYSITGGEPGLISKKIFDSVFELTLRNAIIPTNGLFIDNGMLDTYYSRIDKVLYHCCTEFNNDTIINKLNYDNIEYLILVHNKNLRYLDQFLKLNKNIIFTIKIVEQRGNKKDYLLTQSDLKQLYNILNDNDNIIKSIVNNLKKYIEFIANNQLETIRNTCSIYCFTPQIDFVHNVIRKCYKSYVLMPTIELNKSNFINIIRNKIDELKKPNTICNNCTYLYNFVNIEKIMLERMLFSAKISNG